MERRSFHFLITVSLFFFVCALAGVSSSLAATDTSKMAPEKATMTPTMAMKHMPSNQTLAIQKALNKEGYKLKDDGLMGKHTRAAIEAFQKKNALKITGNPDEETLAKLLGIKYQ
jgi:peptidoglycan hydrolase-like protein with peptidoglycan-binding domain